jgi:hypothetical protein
MVSPLCAPFLAPDPVRAHVSIHDLACLILATDGALESVWDIATRVCDQYAPAQTIHGCATARSSQTAA